MSFAAFATGLRALLSFHKKLIAHVNLLGFFWALGFLAKSFSRSFTGFATWMGELISEVFVITTILVSIRASYAEGLNDWISLWIKVFTEVFVTLAWTITATMVFALFPLTSIGGKLFLLFKQLVFIVPLNTLPRECICVVLILSLLHKQPSFSFHLRGSRTPRRTLRFLRVSFLIQIAIQVSVFKTIAVVHCFVQPLESFELLLLSLKNCCFIIKFP